MQTQPKWQYRREWENENVMKYVNWICYSYNNKKTISAEHNTHSKSTLEMVEYDRNDNDEMADERKNFILLLRENQTKKMNMATDMICDFIFVATNFSP